MSSRRLYDEGLLRPYVLAIQQPRMRYAPEDPDRRAPWTYESDPFRVRQGRRAVQTPLSAVPPVGTKTEREKAARHEAIRLRDEAAHDRMHAEIERCRHAPAEMLYEVFPEDRAGVEALLKVEIGTIRNIMARTLVIRLCTKDRDRVIAAEILGITKERVRQMKVADHGQIPRSANNKISAATRKVIH